MFYPAENSISLSQAADEAYKEVIAFANPDGNITYIGIDEQNNMTGIDMVNETYTRLTNEIRETVHPDKTMFIRYLPQDNNVIRIEVGHGNYQPGDKHTNSFKSSETDNTKKITCAQKVEKRPETISQINGCFEDMCSPDQNLTFNAAEAAFKRYGVEFSPEKYQILGITKDKDYTNLALLLSDQCRHTVKVAVFKDAFCTEFRDSKEFGGSIFKQFEDTANYLTLCNKKISVITGMIRTEKRDYPEEAIREALLNAIVHREYGFSGSIIINVNECKMELISLGGLLPGLSEDDLRVSISQPRNKKLADVFHRLRLIESYGTGIRRIFKLYEGCPTQPHIEISPNAFKIVLPNMNTTIHEDKNEPSNQLNQADQSIQTARIKPIQTTHSTSSEQTTLQIQTVLNYLKNYGELNESELQTLLGVKKTRAYLLARQMTEQGLIQIVGRGVNKKYILSV